MPESQKRRLGDWGEDSACRYLKDRGWTLIERNFRCRFGEIDIIASKQGILAFIEVKTRSGCAFGYPCEAVDGRKQVKIRAAASVFLKMRRELSSLQPRLVVIEIISRDGRAFARHLEDAF